MNKYPCLLVLLLLLLTFSYLQYTQKNNQETFISYDKCRSNGYTKEFCLTRPPAFWSLNSCRCSNGMLGKKSLGFRGQCVCLPKYNTNYNTKYSTYY